MMTIGTKVCLTSIRKDKSGFIVAIFLSMFCIGFVVAQTWLKKCLLELEWSWSLEASFA